MASTMTSSAYFAGLNPRPLFFNLLSVNAKLLHRRQLSKSSVLLQSKILRSSSLLSVAQLPFRPQRTCLVKYGSFKPFSTCHSVHEERITDTNGEYSARKQVERETGIIKQVFTFIGAPKDAMYLGLAGVLPYLATSIVTATLSYQTNLAIENGRTTMLTPETVHRILDIMEPIQIGYGAVILSFLGAIHWGFEWANFGGRNGMTRYLPGILAPAAAWPTLFLPFEFALLTQFGVFTIMYFFDASACACGMAPHWYGNYRWVLTFFIGLSVFVTIWNREMLILHGYHSSSEIKGKQLKEATKQALHGEKGVKSALKAASDKAPSAVHYKESDADRMKHKE
ncbi:hypothetical protein KEM54_006148 [Ascosphaera aggregata]|nr:hypothetical protein KEM54_006148 [Ascosphaera aggregata]